MGQSPVAGGNAATLLDARGMRCPLPIVHLARLARTLSAGDRIVLLTDDPAAKVDIPAWCRLRGHDLVSTEEYREAAGPPAIRSEVRLGAPGT